MSEPVSSWAAVARSGLFNVVALFILALGVGVLPSRGWAGGPPGDVVFAAYNLRNYFRTSASDGDLPTAVPKPVAEIEALIRIVAEIAPDVLGVCELGGLVELEDFRSRLAAAGMNYTAWEFVDAADPERHLALLSRFPIRSRQSRADVPYEVNGTRQKVRRGFLDVTLDLTDTYQLRLVGVHLKSKLDAPPGDAILRRHEAHLLRTHIESIIQGQPSVNLLLYGDFNDTKNESAVQEIMGRRGAPDQMNDLRLTDEVGDRWTHYWKVADLYSRIDYIFVSRGLVHEVVASKTRIYRGASWNEASDHRPIVATIRPVDIK